MTYASLFNEGAISIAKEHHEVYGDEIALSLLGLPCEQFREKYNDGNALPALKTIKEF